MDNLLRPITAEDERGQDVLLERAARFGFFLESFRTESGQTVWEWRQGDGPRPQFVTERVARQWMSDWFERSRTST